MAAAGAAGGSEAAAVACARAESLGEPGESRAPSGQLLEQRGSWEVGVAVGFYLPAPGAWVWLQHYSAIAVSRVLW